MVKRLKLNEKTLREAEPKPGVSYQIFDTEVIGFAARVQASGARTFTIDYRYAGRQRRMTIGRWPEWSVTAARERAKELRRAIDEGQDPLAARDERRGAEPAPPGVSPRSTWPVMIWAVVVVIVGPPAAPRARTGRPLSRMIVGAIEERGRLPGPGRLVWGTPLVGAMNSKSVSWLLSRNP